MGKIYHSIDELVGHTPLVEFGGYKKELGLKANLYGKLEYFNPTGSLKDRAAIRMIEEAENRGELHPGDHIVDFTSGNTGIATAAFANSRGYKYSVVIQPGVSKERSLILKAHGIELLQAGDVPGFAEMMKEGLTMQRLDEIMKAYSKERGYYYLNQGGNPDNPKAHYESTGPEIWEDTGGKVDYVVQLVGTGGTLAGLSKFFREKNPDIRIIAAQPAKASRRSKDNPNPNVIDGVLAFDGVPMLPSFWTRESIPYDECLDVLAEDAYSTGRTLVRTDGFFLGQSAAAALWTATQIAKRSEAEGKNIVMILADNAFKYLSTEMYK